MYFKPDEGNVCSLIRIYDVGGYVVNGADLFDYSGDDWDEDRDSPGDKRGTNFEGFCEALRGMCKKKDKEVFHGMWSNWDSIHSTYIPKLVIECVTASPGQEEAAEYLTKIGFQKIGPITKLKHDVTALNFWVMNGDEFCKAIGYVCEYDPRSKE